MRRTLTLLVCSLIAACAAPAPTPATTPTAAPAPTDAAHGGHDHAAMHGEHDHAAMHGEHDHGAAPADGAGHVHAGPVGHRFDDAAKWSKVFDDPARDAWQKPAHVVELMGVTPGMTVVDLGAGTGYFESYLSKAVGAKGKVIALDPEASMVAHITDRAKKTGLANVEARQIPFDDPQLAAGSVQRVLIVDTWHHIANRETYAKKLAAALAPGGVVYVVDFTMETEKGPPQAHRVAADKVIAELTAGGLKAELVANEQLPDQFVVRASKP